MILFFGIIDFLLLVGFVIIYVSKDPIKEAIRRRRARKWQREWDAEVAKIRAETIRKLEADGITYRIADNGDLANPGGGSILKDALFWANRDEEKKLFELEKRMEWTNPGWMGWYTRADIKCLAPSPRFKRDSSKFGWSLRGRSFRCKY